MQLVDEHAQLSVADVEVHDEANRLVAHDALALQRPKELIRTQASIESEDHDICFDGKQIRYVRRLCNSLPSACALRWSSRSRLTCALEQTTPPQPDSPLAAFLLPSYFDAAAPSPSPRETPEATSPRALRVPLIDIRISCRTGNRNHAATGWSDNRVEDPCAVQVQRQLMLMHRWRTRSTSARSQQAPPLFTVFSMTTSREQAECTSFRELIADLTCSAVNRPRSPLNKRTDAPLLTAMPPTSYRYTCESSSQMTSSRGRV
jgi:hypothetical protein